MTCGFGEERERLENERAHSPAFPSLHQRHSSFSNRSVASPTLQLIFQTFRCFTNVTAHSPTVPLLHQRHSSFSKRSVASPTLQLILQPYRCFTNVTAHSPTVPLLQQRHSSFSNRSVASSTLQLILLPFRCFTNVTAHSPTVPLLHQCYSSFSNPSLASPTSQDLHLRHLASRPCYEYSSILFYARTRKVFTTLPIPAVAFKETTNSPSHPPTPFKYFRGKILLTRQTDYNHRRTNSCSVRTGNCKSGWGCGSISDLPLSTRLELIVSFTSGINVLTILAITFQSIVTL